MKVLVMHKNMKYFRFLKTNFSKNFSFVFLLTITCLAGFAQNRMSVADEMEIKRLNQLNPIVNRNIMPHNVGASDGMRYMPSGTLATSDPVFNRPSSLIALSGVGTSVHYDVIPFVLTCPQIITLSFYAANGGAIAPATADTYLFIYGPGGFNPAAPLSNLIALNDDDNGVSLLSIIETNTLPVGNYTAVVTSFENEPGDFPWAYTLGIDGSCVFGVFNACINENMAPITFSTIGATGIGSATGLPMGVTAAWDADILTISGIPTEAGTFNFNVPITSGSTTTFSGVLNVGDIKNLTTNACATSIQAAVDAARDGDILVIAPGSYAENVTLNKNISFQFTADNDVTISSVTVAAPKELKHNFSFNVTTFTNNGIYTGKGFAGKMINSGTVAPKQP